MKVSIKRTKKEKKQKIDSSMEGDPQLVDGKADDEWLRLMQEMQEIQRKDSKKTKGK